MLVQHLQEKQAKRGRRRREDWDGSDDGEGLGAGGEDDLVVEEEELDPDTISF